MGCTSRLHGAMGGAYSDCGLWPCIMIIWCVQCYMGVAHVKTSDKAIGSILRWSPISLQSKTKKVTGWISKQIMNTQHLAQGTHEVITAVGSVTLSHYTIHPVVYSPLISTNQHIQVVHSAEGHHSRSVQHFVVHRSASDVQHWTVSEWETVIELQCTETLKNLLKEPPTLCQCARLN